MVIDLLFMLSAPPPEPPSKPDPCYPSPCGINARCRIDNKYAICECISEYHGNPYEGCRPECVGSSECPMNKACIRNKCQDPCPGTCGVEAFCSVSNHIPMCSCPSGTTGDAFRHCVQIELDKNGEKTKDPCYPSPCGLNTVCHQANNNTVCECIPGYFGQPSGAGCHPECTISADCPRDKACVNSKCIDPCPGVCGYAAMCYTVNHSPICSCSPQTFGDPFVECKPAQPDPIDPCIPSPCNLNGHCRVINGAAICTYPECITNDDCSYDRSCYNQKCSDPCINACGVNAVCKAINHKPICSCPVGYEGSPFVQCSLLDKKSLPPRPECISDSECSNDKACINQQCKSPCAEGHVCAQNAECHVQAHRPLCVCRSGFTGNAQYACYESKYIRKVFIGIVHLKKNILYFSWLSIRFGMPTYTCMHKSRMY